MRRGMFKIPHEVDYVTDTVANKSGRNNLTKVLLGNSLKLIMMETAKHN